MFGAAFQCRFKIIDAGLDFHGEESRMASCLQHGLSEVRRQRVASVVKVKSLRAV